MDKKMDKRMKELWDSTTPDDVVSFHLPYLEWDFD